MCSDRGSSPKRASALQKQFQIEVEIYLCRRDDRGARDEEIDDGHRYADQGQVGVVVRCKEKKSTSLTPSSVIPTKTSAPSRANQVGRASDLTAFMRVMSSLSYGAFSGFLRRKTVSALIDLATIANGSNI